MRAVIPRIILALLPTVAFAQQSAPTPDTALNALKEMTAWSADSIDEESAATDVLRQVHDNYTDSELDAFARELEKIIRHGLDPQARAAEFALINSAMEGGKGRPYARAATVLIRIYESYRDNPSLHVEAGNMLLSVYLAGGKEYVIKLLQPAMRPQKPCFDTHVGRAKGEEWPPKEEWCDTIKIQSEWCRAADVLWSDDNGRTPGAPPIELFARYCGPFGGVIYIHSDSN